MIAEGWRGWLIAGLPIAVAAAMALSLAVLLPRYFAEPWHPGLPLRPLIARLMKRGGEAGATGPGRPVESGVGRPAAIVAGVLALFALSRLVVFGAAAWGLWQRGELAAMLANSRPYWARWDAPHYLGLIENWYVTEGDPRFHIVFFPLYPLLARGLLPLCGGDSFAAATVLSNLCLAASGIGLYHLVAPQQGRAAGWRAVKFLMFSPLTVFFSAPYTESLFLMLTIFAVLLARRKRFWAAALVGALSAATRVLGVLVAAAIFLEMLKDLAPRNLWPARRRRFFALLTARVLVAALVAAGFGAYLLLNWKVTGNPWQFEIYQREHWHQQMGSIWGTMRYTLANALLDGDAFWRNGTWIPQAIAIALSAALMLGMSRSVYPGDGAYAWLYLVGALSPTWLLSGPRYIAAMYALYPMLASLTKRQWLGEPLTALTAIGAALGGYFYVVAGSLL
ncbi:MAG: hypothetical protein GX558_05820 [Clostridiales bacterium]|nr:hypothetical protein [Clostridiales bacterium]